MRAIYRDGDLITASDVLEPDELDTLARHEPGAAYPVPRLRGERVDEWGYDTEGHWHPERDGAW